MKCVKCNGIATIHIGNLDACKGCFIKIIEKRVRKEIRANRLIEKNDKLLIIDNGSAESGALKYLLKEIILGLPVKITVRKQEFTFGKEINGNFNKILLPCSADMEGEYLLSCFFEEKKPEFLTHYRIKNKLYAKPFLHVMHQESAMLCRIKKIRFTEIKKKSSALGMIEKLQKDYPETAFSVVRSAEEIKKII